MAEIKTEKPRGAKIRALRVGYWRYGYPIPQDWIKIDNLEEYFKASKRTSDVIIREFEADKMIEIVVF